MRKGLAYYSEWDPYAAQWLRNLVTKGHIAPGDVDERSIADVKPEELVGYTQCHFFAGIGVWSHALRRAGWPDSRPVWTGSCPCQPFSSAGKRAGFDDQRHLWPEWFRLIRERKPRHCFGEQVASKDGLSWLDIVLTDLDSENYAATAFDLCAAGVGAPHIRQRLYFVAHAKDFGSTLAYSRPRRNGNVLVGDTNGAYIERVSGIVPGTQGTGTGRGRDGLGGAGTAISEPVILAHAESVGRVGTETNDLERTGATETVQRNVQHPVGGHRDVDAATGTFGGKPDADGGMAHAEGRRGRGEPGELLGKAEASLRETPRQGDGNALGRDGSVDRVGDAGGCSGPCGLANSDCRGLQELGGSREGERSVGASPSDEARLVAHPQEIGRVRGTTDGVQREGDSGTEVGGTDLRGAIVGPGAACVMAHPDCGGSQERRTCCDGSNGCGESGNVRHPTTECSTDGGMAHADCDRQGTVRRSDAEDCGHPEAELRAEHGSPILGGSCEACGLAHPVECGLDFAGGAREQAGYASQRDAVGGDAGRNLAHPNEQSLAGGGRGDLLERSGAAESATCGEQPDGDSFSDGTGLLAHPYEQRVTACDRGSVLAGSGSTVQDRASEPDGESLLDGDPLDAAGFLAHADESERQARGSERCGAGTPGQGCCGTSCGGVPVVVGDTNGERLEGEQRSSDPAGRENQERQVGLPDGTVRSACNGFWHDAILIPCRDGKARPTQPGIFPLAHGATSRVGRLRAYGNAICAPLATEFIRAYLHITDEEGWEPEEIPETDTDFRRAQFSVWWSHRNPTEELFGDLF